MNSNAYNDQRFCELKESEKSVRDSFHFDYMQLSDRFDFCLVDKNQVILERIACVPLQILRAVRSAVFLSMRCLRALAECFAYIMQLPFS